MSLQTVEKMICDNCKQGKMVLPGYPNPKTVCILCWKRVVPPPDSVSEGLWQETGDAKKLMTEFSTLISKVSEFLAQGGFVYSWSELCQHIITGYLVYREVISTPMSNH